MIMGNLLKLEFRKLKRQKSFYVCTLVMVALLFLSALTTNVLLNGNPDAADQMNVSGIANSITAVGNCSFLLIAGIFTALTVCDDYEQQTVKTIFARGYSRKSVYLAKLVSVWLSTTVMFVVVELAAFALGSYFFGVGDLGDFRFLGLVGAQYIACMANVALFFAISSVLRKNGSSIAGTIVAPMLVSMVLGLADSFLKLEDFSLTSVWLSSFMTDLSTLSVGGGRTVTCLVASLCYIPVFVLGGMYLNKKNEL